jgi:SAM-dependent methyltransferase
MATDAPAEFDQIARVYDDTREPLDPGVLASMVRTLSGWGIRSVLEIGVGTGRVAVPLRAQGLEVTGVDASRGMLDRARAKGLDRLVRGSAYRLPFASGTVDAALFVHVLHILEEPARAIAEAQRVGRLGVAGLVRPARAAEPPPDPAQRPRRRVIERLRAQGIPVSDRAAGGPPLRERRLLETYPPQRLVTLDARDVTEPLARELDLFARGASRWTLRVPPDALAKAVDEVRAEVGDRRRTYHRVIALALWTEPPVPRPPSAPVEAP